MIPPAVRAALLPALSLALLPSCERAESPAPAQTSPSPDAWFRSAGHEAGVDFAHVSGFRERPLLPEIMGGGVALIDFDGDGALDVYFVQSGSLHEARSEAAGNRLYRNLGAGTFEDVTDASGAGDRGYGMGVAVGDYDDDGDPDLYVTNVGPNVLLRNEGDGTFVDVSAAAGVGDARWGTSATFADLDADGDLDLFFTNYCAWSIETEMDCPGARNLPDYCPPLNYGAPSRDTLLQNDGDGTFTDVSDRAGLDTAFGLGLGTCCLDFDGDGLLDIFVANDGSFNQLWINRGDLSFSEEGLLRGCAVDEDGLAKAGMGVTAIDYDDDGDRDLLVVNLVRQSDSYYENDGGFFFDRSIAVGLGAATQMNTRFGTGFHDFDHDGWLDLYFANGKIAFTGESLDADDPYAESNMLMRGGPDRVLSVATPGGGTPGLAEATSRGAAFGDLDGDGSMDIVVANRDGPGRILLNVAPGRGNWIALRPRERSGRAALGAVVTARLGERTLTRDCVSGYSYLAASEPDIRIGLGEAAVLEDVVVRWVDGTEESFGSLDAGRRHVLRRGIRAESAAGGGEHAAE